MGIVNKQGVGEQWDFLGWLGAAINELAVIAKHVLIREKIPVVEFLRWLNSEEGRDGFGEAMNILTSSYAIAIKKANRILKFVGKVTIPAATEKFVAKDKFKLKENGGICSFLGPNFINWFLSGDGKIEHLVGEYVLCYAKLFKTSPDIWIVNELDGEEKTETTLFEIFSLMDKQKDGEKGVLLTNSRTNIFYVRDFRGVFRSVGVCWSDGGWYIDGNLVCHDSQWFNCERVFYRDHSSKIESLGK